MSQIPRVLRNTNINLPILIRPHSSYPFKPWLNTNSDLKNILISSSGQVVKTYSKSLMMIHNRFTTGIEAFLSNLPFISYHPLELEEPSLPPSEFINSFLSSVAKTEDELIVFK